MVSSRLTFYASLTSEGRCRLAPPIIDDGAVGKAAMRFQVSAATASRSTRRYRAGQLLIDRSSRPRSSPAQRSACQQLRIVSLHLAVEAQLDSLARGIRRLTVGRVRARHWVPLPHHRDQTTARPAPRPLREATSRQAGARRYQEAGQDPDVGGWRIHGRQPGKPNTRKRAWAARSCITPWATASGSHTRSSWTNNARRMQQSSGFEPGSSSPSTGSL